MLIYVKDEDKDEFAFDITKVTYLSYDDAANITSVHYANDEIGVRMKIKKLIKIFNDAEEMLRNKEKENTGLIM